MNSIKILDEILAKVFPPKCGICNKIEADYLCNKCEANLKKQALLVKESYLLKKDIYFENHIYIFRYDGLIRNLILNYKFNEKSYLYKTFVNFIYKYKLKLNLASYDLVLAVPISSRRMKQRGYNQSNLIAKELAKKINVKFDNKILIKIKDNKMQSTLDKEARQKNIKNVYNITNDKKILNKNILLIDDIFTTGSTVNECAKTLKKFGAKKVDILTLAKD